MPEIKMRANIDGVCIDSEVFLAVSEYVDDVVIRWAANNKLPLQNIDWAFRLVAEINLEIADTDIELQPNDGGNDAVERVEDEAGQTATIDA